MSFIEKLKTAQAVLKEQRRLSIKSLGRELGSDGEELDDIVEELVDIQQVARREGKALVWEDGPLDAHEPSSGQPLDIDARNYTPKYLADKILASRTAMEGERKQVSILFCDIAHSMEMSEALGPETWHDILNRFFKLVTPVIHEYEGTINQYTGDGVMALFGAPIAAEDHARRACMAALDIQKKLVQLQEHIHSQYSRQFVLRTGINSGQVVVGKIGDDLRMDYTAQGHEVGIASRLQHLAPANGILVSPYTARLVEGFIDLESMGVTRIKGVSKPLEIFRPRAINTGRTRLDIARARGFSRFVGREMEMSLLNHALKHALQGHGQTVAIAAPPGTGKSRLCWEFKQTCIERDIPVHSAYGAPHTSMRAYQSMLPLYRSIYGIDEESLNPVEARHRISERVLALSPRAETALPELYAFLGIPDPYNPPPQTPPELQRRLYLDFTRWSFRQLGRQQPMVILLDDLHWFDEASLGMVKALLETVSDTQTLVVVNFRPEMSAPWLREQPNLQSITLQPLDDSALEELMHELLGKHPSTEGLLKRVVDMSGGNPFFVEEVVQDLLEQGHLARVGDHYESHESLDRLPIPASLQSLIASRIDRLSDTDKSILQTAAVIGREFDLALLIEVSELPAADLQQGMQQLQRSEFVYKVADEPRTVWSFKHAITQEVAYNSLLSDRRRELHTRTAQSLEKESGGKPDNQSDLMASHWEAAGHLDKAARARHQAARWAHKLDLREALHHRKEVIRLTRNLPEDDELLHIGAAARRELIQWAAITGITPEEAEQYFYEGCRIAEQTQDFITLGTLIGAYSLLECQRACFTEAIALADRCTAMLRNIKNPEIQATMDGVIFATAYGSAGRVQPACEATARALALTEDEPQLGAIARFNIRIWAGTLHAMTHGAGGHPTQALAELEGIIPKAIQSQDLAAVLSVGFKVWLSMYTGDRSDMRKQCEEALDFARRTDVGYWIGSVHTYYGMTLILQNRWQEALTQFDAVNRLHTQHHFMDYPATLANIYLPLAILKTGQHDRAVHLADKACEMAEASDSYFFVNDACWIYSRVVREVAGMTAIDRLEENLSRWAQCLDDSGMQLCRHLWLWEKASVAALQGNTTQYRDYLEQALVSARQCDAAGHAEEIGKELAA